MNGDGPACEPKGLRNRGRPLIESMIRVYRWRVPAAARRRCLTLQKSTLVYHSQARTSGRIPVDSRSIWERVIPHPLLSKGRAMLMGTFSPACATSRP